MNFVGPKTLALGDAHGLTASGLKYLGGDHARTPDAKLIATRKDIPFRKASKGLLFDDLPLWLLALDRGRAVKRIG